MATMAVPSWAETQALIAQTQRLYETNDDVQMVKDVAQLRNSIVQTRSHQADQMAQAIAALSKHLQEAKAAVASSEASTVSQSAIGELEETREGIKSHIEDLTTQSSQTEENTAALRAQVEVLHAKLSTVESSTAIPHVQLFIGMYRNITNINWDYEAQDMIEGAVIPPAGGVVKSFKIDPSTTTECEVADTLWELVEQAHSPAAVAAGSC